MPVARPPGRAGPRQPPAATGRWAGPAARPLLPALIFMIIVTQLPFVATLVISFTDWNALLPDRAAASPV